MRIGKEVIRIREEFNECKVGDIRKIKNMKIYNGGLVLNFEGDKLDTWQSAYHFRLIEDVDIPCLQRELEEIKAKVDMFKEKVKERRKSKKNDIEQEVVEMSNN